MNLTIPEVKDRSKEFIYCKGIEFLETICDIWPVKLAMLKAEQSDDWDAFNDAKVLIEPIVKKAQGPLTEALKWRYLARELYESDADFRTKENADCAVDFVRFINNWCFTSDPRMPPLGLPSMLPFVLWPKQEEFLIWVNEAYLAGRSWLAEKSRGWGITWLLCAYYVWHWLFHEGFVGGFGSRDKDAVDRLGDPDTIFSKVRFLIYNLPQSMLPTPYQGKTIANQSSFDNYLRIINPENESTIRGEGGDNIGAGGRASIYVVDEAALVLHPEMIDDSLSYTTNCRGDVSTVRGMNHFGEKRHSGRVRVFTSWFYQDPSKHKNWRTNKLPSREECPFLDHEFLDKGDLIVAQELLIDYSRSVEDSFIPADWIRAAVDFDIPAIGIHQSGFDIASGGANESVYSCRVGSVLLNIVELDFDTPQEALESALNHAEEDKIEVFAYDRDGIGESVLGHMKFTDQKIRFDMFGVHGNAPASDKFLFSDGQRAKDKFRNKRAENWWNVRERFRKTFEHRKGVRMYDYDELISIPNNNKLIMQLSQPKKGYGSKITIENKDKMRCRGVKSPDHADSVIMAFADTDRDALVISAFNYQDGAGNIGEFDIDPESPIGQQYVSLVTTSEMKTYALGCLWIPYRNVPVMKIFCEFVEPSNDIKKLTSELKETMCEVLKPIKEWICDSDMISSMDEGKDSVWYLYKKERVNLRKNYQMDYGTAIIIVNQMFTNNIIQVHSRCSKLMMQLANWRLVDGKPQQDLGFAMALCHIAIRLRTKKEINLDHVKPQDPRSHAYRNSMGRFGNTSKESIEDLPVPLYMKMAQDQINNNKLKNGDKI
jgi:phage terminase large subunit